MAKNAIVPFKISTIDSLGQGVSKISEKVTFIPKTAVGDSGEAVIMAEKKGVIFARLNKLKHTSPERIVPECTHFQNCFTCHLLHLPYESELKIKEDNFYQMMRKLNVREVEVIGAPQRLHYRNRIQLHFSLKSKLLGMRDPQTFQIIPIPECKIGRKEILDEIRRLYHNNQWLKEVPPNTSDGHVEIYWNNNHLQLTWNRPYAEGGFTQVYEEMNLKLKNKLTEEHDCYRELHTQDLLDLFGGNGNLSESLRYSKRLVVDLYSETPSVGFYNQNIYSPDAIMKLKQEIVNQKLNIRTLLIDPPRSGLKDINQWLMALVPELVVYVSCDPHTLARDLSTIQGYDIKKSFIFDFFPSTFHFECMIFLERKA